MLEYVLARHGATRARRMFAWMLLIGTPSCGPEVQTTVPALALETELDIVLSDMGDTSSTSGTTVLMLPAFLRFSNTGDLWVLDTGQRRAYLIDDRGKIVASYGTEGIGPGEFRVTVGMDVSSSGTVWLADAASGKIVQFLSPTEYHEQVLPFRPGGVVAARNGDVWVIGDLLTSLFRRYTDDGRQIGTVGTPAFLGGQSYRFNQGVAARGSTVCAVVWAYTYASKISCFSEAGTEIWSRDGPVSVFPERNSNPFRMSQRDVFAYTDVVADDGRVYALFSGAAGDPWSDILHVYEEENGEFLGAQRMPRVASHFARNKRTLAILAYDPSPTLYRYHIVREE